MKKSDKKILALFAVHELLLILLGMGIAFRAESRGADGTLLILPLAAALVAFGWIWRWLCEDSKK